MKTTIILLTAFLFLQSAVMMALTPDNGLRKSESFIGELYINIENSNPIHVLFVAFSDGTETSSENTVSIDALAPVTPKVAEFEEVQPEPIDIEKLAPVLPSETEFEAPAQLTLPTPYAISPTAPAEAEFID